MPRYPEDVLVEQWAPGVTRAAVIRDPSITSGTGQFGAIQAVAPALGVELTSIDARDANGGVTETRWKLVYHIGKPAGTTCTP